MDEVQFKSRIERIHADLERYSYYELLNLKPEATLDEVRAAFHRMALTLHPDRYLTHPDEALRQQVYAIYKRMTEGYRVLSNSRTRRDYDARLSEGQLRYDSSERKKAGLRQAAEAIENPQARKFFQLGQAAEQQGNLKSAQMNYTLALNLAGQHPLIQQHLERVKAKGG